MKDYSQYGEQEHVARICEGIERGRLLDIGAWHAECFSNTRALIESGWSAVLVEPSPGPLAGLVRFYADAENVMVLGCPITVEGGPVRMDLSDDAVSSEQPSREWLELKSFYGRATMFAMSLKQLFAFFGGDFEMVNIDVEGTSVDLFAEMVRIGPRPRCVVVEHDNRIVELMGYAQAANYESAWVNGTNVVLRWSGKRE